MKIYQKNNKEIVIETSKEKIVISFKKKRRKLKIDLWKCAIMQKNINRSY